MPLHPLNFPVAPVLLTALLAVGCWFDVRSHRIPNKLVVLGMAAGILCNALLLPGVGIFDAARPGMPGVAASLWGLVAGFAAFLPLYLLRGMGAGDVKLMGMVGSFVGPLSALDAAVMTLAVGGVVAMMFALCARNLGQALSNVRVMMAEAMMGTPGGIAMRPVGKVPYAIAIAGGTFVHALLAYSGHAVLI